MRMGITGPLSPEERETIVRETYAHFDRYLNRWPEPVESWDSGTAVEWEGEGVHVKDIHGRTFIDFLGGYGIFTLGHRHPFVLAAVQAQLGRLALHSQKLINPYSAEAARRLAEISPGSLCRTFFCNSGTESVEGALKLARLTTRKTKFISTVNSFHGKTMGSLSVTGRDLFRKPILPLLPVTFVPYGDAEAIDRAIDVETAGVILEPIQGEGGVIIPPDDYLRRVRDICTARGVLMIADEVQTGLGRTGKMWGVDHAGVVPDIMCVAKALSGGIIPVGAFHTTDEIWKSFHPLPLFQTSTFGSNPLAMTAASAAIEVTVKEKLPEKCARTGAYLLLKLQGLAARYPGCLKTVRGKGLLIGIETTTEEIGVKLASLLYDRNVLVAHTLNNPRVIRMEPPLIVDTKLCDEVLGRLDDALKALASSAPARS